MTENNMALRIRFLGGTLSGRELQIPPGIFTFGGEDGDVALQPECCGQAELRNVGGELELVSAVPCWVDGIKHAPGLLPAGKVIDLSGIHFIIGGPGMSIPSVMVPQRKKTTRRLKMKLPVFVGVLAVAVIYFLMVTGENKTNEPDLRQVVESALHGWKGLSYHWTAPLQIELSGRCSDSALLAKLVNSFSMKGVRVIQEVICNDDLERAVYTVFAGRGFPDVSVRVQDDGYVLIDGPSGGNLAELMTELSVLPGITGWDISDSGTRELMTIISALKKQGLLSGLNAVRSRQCWVFTGMAEAKTRNEIKNILDSFSQKKPGYCLRYAETGESSSVIARRTYRITSISGNDRQLYARLDNGTLLAEGGVATGGMKVMEVSRGGVSLAGQEGLEYIPVRGVGSE